MNCLMMQKERCALMTKLQLISSKLIFLSMLSVTVEALFSSGLQGLVMLPLVITYPYKYYLAQQFKFSNDKRCNCP